MGTLDRITKARIPLGSYDYGLGVTPNDLLYPFADSRGDGQMLPEDFSLEELGGLLGHVVEGLSPKEMATGIIDAINGVDETGRPLGLLERAFKLFPLGGGAGGLLGKVERAAVRDGIAAVSPDAPIPHGLAVGDVYPDTISAQKAWTAAGGKQSGLTVKKLPDGTYTHAPVPVPPAVAPNTGAVPAPSGWNRVVAPGGGAPPGGPLPPAPSVDRRGLPGRDPVGPRTPIAGLTDPEGRPLHQEAAIAGVRTPGGPDVPLSMPEEIALAKRLGDFRTPMGMAGANGGVVVKVPGTMDPPSPPQVRIEVDASKPDDVYMNAVRHEIGHAIDYWGERTQRGRDVGFRQYEIPDDVRGELERASAVMRPHLWAPDRDVIMQRSKAVLDEYRARPDELIADGKRFYQEDPAGFKAKYPNAAAYVRAQVNDDPLLSGIVQFNARAKPTGAVVGSLFDYSRLHEVPSVPQFDLPRVVPPKGPSARAQALDTPSTVAGVNAAVDRGAGAGIPWYNTEPLRRAFVDRLGEEEGARRYALYMDMVAATSPRSDVGTNARNASYYYQQALRGDQPAKPLPKPYGHMAQNLHVQNYDNIMQAGGTMGPGGTFPVLQNPKPPSFSQNLQGNQRPVTADTHYARLWGQSAGSPDWLMTTFAGEKGAVPIRPQALAKSGEMAIEDMPASWWDSVPRPNEYGFLEMLGQREAAKKGMTPAQYQASAWVGGGEMTGLASGAEPFMKHLENRIVKTAQARGETPLETLRKFIDGEATLLSAGPEAGLIGAAADANDDDAVREALGLGRLPAGLVGSVKAGTGRKPLPRLSDLKDKA